LTSGLSLARSPRFNLLSTLSQDDLSQEFSLVFLGSKDPKDTHNGSSALFAMNWNPLLQSLKQQETKALSREELIDITSDVLTEIIPTDVQSPHPGEGEVTVGGYTFPGLYSSSLPSSPFINKSVLFLETQWRSHGVILCVNITTKEIQTLHHSSLHEDFALSAPFHASSLLNSSERVHRTGSWLTSCEPSSSILDIHPVYGLLLLTSTPTIPPVLVHLNLSALSSSVSQSQSISFPFLSTITTKATATSTHSPLPSREGMSAYILHTSYGEDRDDFESIVILPPSSEASPPPLLVVPHGGPHSAFTTAYVAQYSDYLSLLGGYALLLINYRGSTGYGQEQLNSLPGKIGLHDVQDVFQATQGLISLDHQPPLVSSQCGIFGGSHGGFLTAHLIGQYPELYAAAALRNPVINIPAMFTTSDIPDWCVVEACGLGSYDFQKYQLPSEEQYHAMALASPIRSDPLSTPTPLALNYDHSSSSSLRYVSATTTPVLLCLGAKDKRVPWSQGLQYYYALKSQRGEADEQPNSTCQLRVYREADHAIDKPNAEADQWISIKGWFDKYMK
jgi:pimeloyl-ACP methyl ester carboxylesterase